uniref:SEFIR domain-containing protein n=1 Tax=Clastoptera arizonana TaxID=38151 RepID=A0A1B6C653_9HEMI
MTMFLEHSFYLIDVFGYSIILRYITMIIKAVLVFVVSLHHFTESSEISCAAISLDEMGFERVKRDDMELYHGIYTTCDKEDCDRLKSTKVAFSVFPAEKRLRIAFETPIPKPLELTVASAYYNFTCVGGIYDFEVYSWNLTWRNTNEALCITGLNSSMYYCIRVNIEKCYDCPVCTRTQLLIEPPGQVIITSNVLPIRATVLHLSMLALFLISVGIGLLLFRQYCRLYSCLRKSHYARYPPHSSKEVTPIVSTVPIIPATDSNDIYVLLLYSRDCKSLHDVMKCLISLLENCGLKVFDPFDPKDIDVRANKEGWLENLFQKPNLKVILVETEVAVIRQKQFLSDDYQFDFEDPYDLDSIFICGLSRIQSCVDFYNNYRRLFVVRY